MNEDMDFLRPYNEPSGPEEGPNKHDSIRNSKAFYLITYAIELSALAWILAIDLFHVHPSRLTITFAFFCLMFYSGEYISWKRPHFRKRQPKHAPWRDR